MLFADPEVAFRDAFNARLMQVFFRAMFKRSFAEPELQLATKPIAPARTVWVPTRHGKVRTLIYSPMQADIDAWERRGRKPPVHFITHGGAFIIRMPEQEDNVARYLASEIGCYVVLPDFDSAPSVRFPVSEEEAYDVLRWTLDNADTYGWDRDVYSIGGASSGGKIATTLVEMAIEAGDPLPVALSTEYATVDLARDDATRTSPKPNPIVPPQMMALVRATYFKDVDTTNPLASPLYYDKLDRYPPTLIMTAGQDTLRHEMHDFAGKLEEAGVPVTFREFDGVDHGFTHAKPVDVGQQAIRMIGDHLRKAYA